MDVSINTNTKMVFHYLYVRLNEYPSRPSSPSLSHKLLSKVLTLCHDHGHTIHSFCVNYLSSVFFSTATLVCGRCSSFRKAIIFL